MHTGVMSSFATGLFTALPLMVVIGPVSILLIDVAIRDRAGAAAAAAGVSTADLMLGTVAWVGGSVLARTLASVDSFLSFGAVLALVVVAAAMARRAWGERRLLAEAATGGEIAAPAASAAQVPQAAAVRSLERRGRLFAMFFGMTVVNPLTVVAMVALVVASGSRRPSFAWVGGIWLSSVIAHGSWTLVGVGLGAAISPSMRPWIRFAGSAAVAATAVWLAFG